MAQDRSVATRTKLVEAGTQLMRTKGFVATRIDEVCELAAVTKGAFFHHFSSKEDLAEACLTHWDRFLSEMLERAPFQSIPDPRARVFGFIDFFSALFDNPAVLKACLAGTTAQQISSTHPQLRQAANLCLANGAKKFQDVLDGALGDAPTRVDTASLASLWMATFQGSLTLARASEDPSVIRRNFNHMKTYIASLLPAEEPRK